MRRRALQSLKRIIAILSVLLLIIMLVVLIRSLDIGSSPNQQPVPTAQSTSAVVNEIVAEPTAHSRDNIDEATNVEPPVLTPLEHLKSLPIQVALISGHAQFDSGAICTDENGEVRLREVDINAMITELVIAQLEAANLEVVPLHEHDQRLYGLEASLLVSLHSDSCIDASIPTPPNNLSTQRPSPMI